MFVGVYVVGSLASTRVSSYWDTGAISDVIGAMLVAKAYTCTYQREGFMSLLQQLLM